MTNDTRAEAVFTTEAASLEDRSLGEEAIYSTLPFKKASSSGRFDREARGSSRRRCPYVVVQSVLRRCCRRRSLPLRTPRRRDFALHLVEAPLTPESSPGPPLAHA